MPEMIPKRTLQEIETEIRAHSQYVTASIIAIGNGLIEAKAQLEHGQWEGWLVERVHFSQRTANNFMRIAREIGTGSSLVTLPYTKVLALLDVPAEQREAAAAEVDANNRSAAAIRKALADRDRERERCERVETERRNAEAERDRYRKAAEEAGRQAEAAASARDRASQLSVQYNEKLTEVQAELTALKNRPLPTIATTVAPDDYEEYKAKAAQAEAYRRRAEEAETYAIQQEAAAKQAQAAARRAQAEQIEHSVEMDSVPYSAQKLGEAVRAFMAAMGMIPNMGAYFFGLSADRLADYRPYIAMMRAWVDGAEGAIRQPEAMKAEAISGEG